MYGAVNPKDFNAVFKPSLNILLILHGPGV